MKKEVEITYKLRRMPKDSYWDQWLVTIDGGGYYWADDYECADMFVSPDVLRQVVNRFAVEFDNNKYEYDIIGECDPEIITF